MANRAGKNCIFAIHPNHVCNVPVKSSNSKVISIKNTVANAVLVFLNLFIIQNICLL